MSTELALEVLQKAKSLKTEEEVAEYFSLTAALCIAALRGMKGEKFIKGFLESAIEDDSFSIEAHRVN